MCPRYDDTAFSRYIGIDYSGAKTPTSSLKGLRIYEARGDASPTEVAPPPSPRKYWTRKEIGHWLVECLAENVATLVGIDHGFSLPLSYFETHGIPLNWPDFLDDFVAHWPTDGDHTYVDSVRHGAVGNGAARSGSARWRRLTEKRTKGAKSVFHFDVQGAVAKSTHAGIPWLRFIRQQFPARVHFWPFDGWEIPAGRSAIVEVYPALWSRSFCADGRTADQHDAFSIAAWLSRADHDCTLGKYLEPALSPSERADAEVEGWILGVSGSTQGIKTHESQAVAGVKVARRRSKKAKDTSGIEVTNISPHGIWVLAQGEEIFLPYEKFPWFKRGRVEAVLKVEEQSPGHYYWPDLDVDLEIDAMRNPDRYPLSFSSER